MTLDNNQPATEFVCKCEHGAHVGTSTGCLYVYDLGRMETCDCTGFQPTTEPVTIIHDLDRAERVFGPTTGGEGE